MRAPGRSALLLLGAALFPAACASAQRAAPAAAGGLLAPARIAALPAAPREAWTRYLETSRRDREADRAPLQAELRTLGRERWTPAPAGPALAVDDSMTEAWFRGEAARRTAGAILSFQTPSGGWSKRVKLDRPRLPGESFSSENGWSYVGTFDNGATTGQLRFLARAFRATGDDRYRASFLRGLEYVLRAQFPSGCWPQVYPLQGSYHDAATLNDDAMVNVLRLLRELAGEGGEEFAFVPAELRARSRAAVARGVECLLDAQVVTEGRPTVWGAQHDPITLQPVAARAYEHASLSGRESAAVLLFLMELEPGDARVARAVRGGVEWLRANAIHGYDYVSRGELTPREGAGPIWARFYELGTNRPIFSNRDGVVRYAWSELEDERKYGYAWFTDEPARVLRRYERWARRAGAGADGKNGGLGRSGWAPA